MSGLIWVGRSEPDDSAAEIEAALLEREELEAFAEADAELADEAEARELAAEAAQAEADAAEHAYAVETDRIWRGLAKAPRCPAARYCLSLHPSKAGPLCFACSLVDDQIRAQEAVGARFYSKKVAGK